MASFSDTSFSKDAFSEDAFAFGTTPPVVITVDKHDGERKRKKHEAQIAARQELRGLLERLVEGKPAAEVVALAVKEVAPQVVTAYVAPAFDESEEEEIMAIAYL